MAGRVRRGVTEKHGLTAALRHAAQRSLEAVVPRSIVAGAALTLVLLSTFVLSLFGGVAAATSTVTKPLVAISRPTVILPTVTRPTVTLPTVTRPTITITNPTATTPPATTTPTVTTPPIATPPATAPTVTTPKVTPPKATGSSSSVARQRQLRSLVVRLSGCLATLPLQGKRLLLLRAGIETALNSRIAVARALHISRQREAQLEHASLLGLQTAARDGGCSSDPVALIEVPARDQLVSVDPVLSNAGRFADSAGASRAAASGVENMRAKLSFTLAAGEHAAAVKQVIVALPVGLRLSSSRRHLVKGIVAKVGGRRLKLTAQVRHGRLTIKFKTPAVKVRFTIARPAITVSKKLAHRVKIRIVKGLLISVAVTGTSHQTTHQRLDFAV
jgi:hypothetical protein